MTTPVTSKPEFFEAKYRRDADPWNFSKSEYELLRYDTIVDALKDRRYKRTFEPGCSVGVLSARLAPLTDYLLAIDFSPSAVAQAKSRCSTFPNVEVRCASFPEFELEGDFDLMVLSEIGYYFDPDEWAKVVRSIAEKMKPSAVLLAAHWLGHSDEHRMSGDTVHEITLANVAFPLERSERYESFRLDKWTCA